MELTAVPGVPETALGSEVEAGLPPSAPPAPWDLEFEALLWPGWPQRAAARALSGRLAGSRVLLRGGGLIRYLGTPVGPYDEVLAAALLWHRGRPATHVPFMAVDSPASLVGGRTNWSLPKALAEFEGEPRPAVPMRARGEGWGVEATARPLGPSLPFRGSLAVVQQWPDGSVRHAVARLAGRARAARVTVELAGGPELRAWLPAARRLGLLVERARGTLGSAGPVSALPAAPPAE